MPIEVEVQGLGVIEFPDGTSEAVIRAKVKELLDRSQPVKQQAKPAGDYDPADYAPSNRRPTPSNRKPIGEMAPKEYKTHLAAEEETRRPEMTQQVRAKIRAAFEAGDFEGGILSGLAHNKYVSMDEVRKAEAQWREKWRQSGKTPPSPAYRAGHDQMNRQAATEEAEQRRFPPPAAYSGLPSERVTALREGADQAKTANGGLRRLRKGEAQLLLSGAPQPWQRKKIAEMRQSGFTDEEIVGHMLALGEL